MNQKYICTMGPSINNDEMLKKLYEQGMRIIRFNMSHMDYDLKNILERIEKLKSQGYNIKTMIDTKGPEIRLVIKEKRAIQKDEILTLGKDFDIDCDIHSLEVNDILLIDDAQVQLKFLGSLNFQVLNDGVLKNKAGVYSEKLNSNLKFLNASDLEDIKKAFTLNVDWLAVSLVRGSDDILNILKLKAENKNVQTQIMSKIETKEALRNFLEILKVSDGIMIARGDLGVVFPYDLGKIQDTIIKKTLPTNKMLVVGTGFLKSLKTNLVPMRSEVIDLYEVLAKGVKWIMFSGETAIAKDPLLVLDTANKIGESIKRETML